MVVQVLVTALPTPLTFPFPGGTGLRTARTTWRGRTYPFAWGRTLNELLTAMGIIVSRKLLVNRKVFPPKHFTRFANECVFLGNIISDILLPNEPPVRRTALSIPPGFEWLIKTRFVSLYVPFMKGTPCRSPPTTYPKPCFRKLQTRNTLKDFRRPGINTQDACPRTPLCLRIPIGTSRNR